MKSPEGIRLVKNLTAQFSGKEEREKKEPTMGAFNVINSNAEFMARFRKLKKLALLHLPQERKTKLWSC